jgi:hypothetical protein
MIDNECSRSPRHPSLSSRSRFPSSSHAAHNRRHAYYMYHCNDCTVQYDSRTVPYVGDIAVLYLVVLFVLVAPAMHCLVFPLSNKEKAHRPTVYAVERPAPVAIRSQVCFQYIQALVMIFIEQDLILKEDKGAYNHV